MVKRWVSPGTYRNIQSSASYTRSRKFSLQVYTMVTPQIVKNINIHILESAHACIQIGMIVHTWTFILTW
jgi:hypothetical protein